MKNKQNEHGFILLELIIGLPLIAMLLATIGATVIYSVHQYQVCRADWELQSEMTQAFSTVLDDFALASAVKKDPYHYGGILLEQPKVTASGKLQTKTVTYWLHNIKGRNKLVKDDDGIPLTGDNVAAGVIIRKLSLVENTNFPGVYELTLTGVSWETGHEYSLVTAIYLPPKTP